MCKDNCRSAINSDRIQTITLCNDDPLLRFVVVNNYHAQRDFEENRSLDQYWHNSGNRIRNEVFRVNFGVCGVITRACLNNVSDGARAIPLCRNKLIGLRRENVDRKLGSFSLRIAQLPNWDPPAPMETVSSSFLAAFASFPAAAETKKNPMLEMKMEGTAAKSHFHFEFKFNFSLSLVLPHFG